jgi:glutamate synthase domain-containing protein 2
MVEIKISQGAKPGHGGILPAVKVDQEIADIRRVEVGKSVISPPGHTAFTNPKELCLFIQRLRELSQGKPIGFKMCIGRREEFIQICEAMRDSKIYPDFITIDGGEGGTGAAPFDFINYVGSPLSEALYFANTTLKEFGVREHVKLIASGKVLTAFNIFEKLALGADLCNSARGMMLALGCIQAYRCNTNKCPTGIATNDPSLEKGLDKEDKAKRVENFHRGTMIAMADLLGAVGLHSTKDVELKHVSCRWHGRVLTLAELYKNIANLAPHEQHDRYVPSQGEPVTPKPPVDS